ncbi:MAG: hypothetical protein HN790_05530 [Methylococcales bacterium]|jgi:hypothetical protein|nr:hypothetical protein [Methylococcales bacterium]
MGIYINTPDGKESFLSEHASEVTIEEIQAYEYASGSKLVPVFLADNGSFTAAAVAYDKSELTYFSQLDGPIRYFLVNKSALSVEVLGNETYLEMAQAA